MYLAIRKSAAVLSALLILVRWTYFRWDYISRVRPLLTVVVTRFNSMYTNNLVKCSVLAIELAYQTVIAAQSAILRIFNFCLVSSESFPQVVVTVLTHTRTG